MGENERWAEPGRPMPNGLLPRAGHVMRAVDTDRWSRAEERTTKLIACSQPNQLSEERRTAVADYVQRLIKKCFPCQVPRHHMSGFEATQTSGSESVIPFAPMLIDPGSRHRMNDDSGLIAFYPAGPPIPFLTMLPMYNVP